MNQKKYPHFVSDILTGVSLTAKKRLSRKNKPVEGAGNWNDHF